MQYFPSVNFGNHYLMEYLPLFVCWYCRGSPFRIIVIACSIWNISSALSASSVNQHGLGSLFWSAISWSLELQVPLGMLQCRLSWQWQPQGALLHDLHFIWLLYFFITSSFPWNSSCHHTLPLLHPLVTPEAQPCSSSSITCNSGYVGEPSKPQVQLLELVVHWLL